MAPNAFVNETPENLALRVLQCHRLPKKCAERRTVFQNLIELTRIGAPPLKIVAAQQISQFLDDFPDLEEDAINAVYDLCEDSLTEVRVEGYKAIVSVSQANPKWGKRNVDVLVQLLQIDQESEVLVVKSALGEHLGIDTKTTISVLCDQLVMPNPPIIDEDDRLTRERLRSLVLSYLVHDARRLIVDACRKTPQLSRDIVAAIDSSAQQFDLQDLCTLLQQLVFSLPGYAPKEDGTTDLFPSLIRTAATHIKSPNLGSSRPYLELLLSLATDNNTCHEKFLSFTTAKFLQGSRLEAYAPEDKTVILSVFAETLSTFPFPGKMQVRNAAWNVCPYAIEQLGNPVKDKTQGKILKIVLHFCMECLSRCFEETPRSDALVACARKIAADEDLKHLQHIARYIIDAPSQRHKRPFKHRQEFSTNTSNPVAQAPPFQSNNSAHGLQLPHLQPRQQRNSFSGLATRPQDPPARQASGEIPRPQKRARTDDDVGQGLGQAPSLLARMKMPAAPYSAPSTPVPMGHSSQRGDGRGGPLRQDQQAQNDVFSGGLSIKGAASRQTTKASAPQVSLLERLADPRNASRGGRGGGRGRGHRGHF